MKRWILGVLMELTVWGTAFPADAALVMSGAGTMRFQWVDLRDSGGSSLSALPSGLTAIGDAVAFGFAEGGAYSANYWKNGVLSNDVWVKVPLALGDLYESELSVSGELDFGPGFVNVYCLTWSTIYFHNETAESYTAEFSVDYAATLSAADPEEFTDFNMVASELYISDFINDPPYLGYRDAVMADGVGSYNRSVNLNVLLVPGWTTVDVKRISWIYVESSIPEPSAFCLAGLAAVGLLWTRCRSRVPRRIEGNELLECWNRPWELVRRGPGPVPPRSECSAWWPWLDYPGPVRKGDFAPTACLAPKSLRSFPDC